jgi:aminopeptidase N
MLLLPLSEAGDGPVAQLLIHTVTHAAFFSRRAWIYEGLAHYAQALMVEEQFGRGGALQFLAQRRAALAIADSDQRPGSDLIQADEEIFYRTKAMFVWWMLRDMVGEQSLHNALSKYRADQDKEPSYVQRLLENESKRKLETFFDDWVYRDRGLPEFRVISVYARQHVRGGYLVTVTVENSGNAGAEVPVRANAKGTSGTERLYVAARSKASIRIDLPLPPTEAVVNDGSVPETDVSNNTYTVVETPQ